jgi:hypothetical protein
MKFGSGGPILKDVKQINLVHIGPIAYMKFKSYSETAHCTSN